MPLVGKWAQRLGENGQLGSLDARFPRPGGEALALDPEEITDIELGGDLDVTRVEFLSIEVNLHPAGDVGEIEEATLAHVAVSGHTARNGHSLAVGKGLTDLGNGAAGPEGATVGIDSQFAELRQFLTADGD